MADRYTPDNTRAVAVVWHDAHTDNQGTWFDPENSSDNNGPYPVVSVGTLLHGLKDGHISIAQSFATVDGMVDSVLHIPNEMVVTIRYYGYLTEITRKDDNEDRL